MVGGLDPRKETLEEARGAIPRAKRERLASTRSMARCRYEGRSGGKGGMSTEPGNSDSFGFLLETDIQATREEWEGGSGEVGRDGVGRETEIKRRNERET